MSIKVIGFKADEDLIELIDEHAKRTDRSRSGMLRTMVNDWIMDRPAARLLGQPAPYTAPDLRAGIEVAEEAVSCGRCQDTGEVDSGGFSPQGHPISVSCPDCRIPPDRWPACLTEPGAAVGEEA